MSLLDAAAAIDEFAKPLSRARGAGTYVAGRYDAGTLTYTAIRGVFLAMSAEQLRDLPEGMRSDDMRTLWTRSEVLATDDGLGTAGDLISELAVLEIGTGFVLEISPGSFILLAADPGKIWRAIQVSDRVEGGFYRAICARIDDRGRSI